MRLRTLTEAEAYARCYGDGDDSVRFIRIEPRGPRLFHGVSGEDLRLAFESRLESREVTQEAMAELLVEAVADTAPAPASNGHKPAAAA